MGRRTRPVVAEVEELSELAADLRAVRRAAGNPPLRTMAMKARYSASTLSEAQSGRRLPTLPVLLAYVTACEADPAGWEERWRQVGAAVHAHEQRPAAALPDAPSSEADQAEPSAPGPTDAGPVGRRRQLMLVGGAALLLVAGAFTVPARTRAPASERARDVRATASPSPQVITEDTDPQDTGCDRTGVSTVASVNLYGPDRLFLGSVWLRHAPACGAMWTRFEPGAGMTQLSGARVTVRLVRPSDGRTLRYEAPYLGLSVYGNMLRTDRGCLKAEATVSAPHPTRGPAVALPPGDVTGHAETPCTKPPRTSDQ